MFRYIGACEAQFGADPYMVCFYFVHLMFYTSILLQSMIHLAKNNYDIKTAMETLDLPNTDFQKEIKKQAWDAEDLLTFKKAMSVRKNYKAMSQIAKRVGFFDYLYVNKYTFLDAIKEQAV